MQGLYVDVFNKTIYPAELTLSNGKIASIKKLNSTDSPYYIMPGFIDSHVHIESSMLIPSEFARLAVVHGTVATVSDPHEIANVCGMEGVEFMIENGSLVPFKFYFGAPSCVPATQFETAGAVISAKDIDILLQRKEIVYLSEMMNFPGVLYGDPEVMEKIAIAHRYGKPVDGHAPGLRGEDAKKYIEAGISTDHECFTAEEALDKLQHGMKIIIREGSAAKNFEALIDLLHDHEDQIMFCSDDKHPDSLVEGHINQLCARAVQKGIDLFKIIKAACINPVQHYKMNVGLLRKDDPADFILVKDLESFEVYQTWVNGELVAEGGKTLIRSIPLAKPVNHFKAGEKAIGDFSSPFFNPVIQALDGQLITKKMVVKHETNLPDQDILKIVVINRYADAPVAKSFIHGFGFKRGAIASSVAHDSHNIVAVGVDDESIMRAVNLVIKEKGGVSCVDGEKEMVLPLPVGGLMSQEDGYKVAEDYAAIDRSAKELGSTLSAPFMTLSFMALLVIPELKLSDKGLFDGGKFEFVRT